MKIKTVLVALATLSTLGLGVAHADNVFWSVGVSQPGVQVGVSNTPPRPAPVIVVPQPVYYPPMVVQPAPVVQTAYVRPGHGHHGRFERERERERHLREWREHEHEHGDRGEHERR